MPSIMTVDSPIGPLGLVVDDGAVTSLQLEAAPARQPGDAGEEALMAEAVSQLDAYFAGSLRHFNVALRSAGTPFQRAVWRELEQIPYGTVTSYGEIARRVGRPRASRAIGAANGRNPIAIIVPCHRVIGADGTLTGYGGGMWRKRWLLTHEGCALAAS